MDTLKISYIHAYKGMVSFKKPSCGSGWYISHTGRRISLILTITLTKEEFKFSLSFPFNKLSDKWGWNFSIPFSAIAKITIHKDFIGHYFSIIPKSQEGNAITLLLDRKEKLLASHLAKLGFSIEVFPIDS